MDMESGKQQFITLLKKYQYVVLLILIGAILMLLPQKTEELPQNVSYEINEIPDLEIELSAILSKISGVGEADVLLTEAFGSDTIYQMDSAQNNSDTVIIMDRNREETGLVKQILPPVYQGAVIVCQGADSATVRLSVVAAVKSVTGLSSDCITVLKMK